MDSEKKIGEIAIITEPYVTPGYKYVVDVRAFEPIPVDLLQEETFNVLSTLTFANIEKAKAIQRMWGRLGIVLDRLDKERGETFHHYRFYVSIDDKYDTEDILNELIDHLKENENAKIQTGECRKISRFPWERKKTKKIPITKKMIYDIVKSRVDKTLKGRAKKYLKGKLKR